MARGVGFIVTFVARGVGAGLKSYGSYDIGFDYSSSTNQGVASVSPIAQEFNPWDYRITHSDVVITLVRNAETNELISDLPGDGGYLKGIAVRINAFLFDPEDGSSLSNSAIYYGFVRNYRINQETIEVECTSLIGMLEEVAVTMPVMAGIHPLQLLSEYVYAWAGLTTSDWDSSDYDYTSYTDISHFNVSNIGFHDDGSKSREGEQVPLMDVARDIAQLCDGYIEFNTSSKLTFTRAATAGDSATTTLVADDLDDFRIVDGFKNFTTHIAYQFGTDGNEGRPSKVAGQEHLGKTTLTKYRSQRFLAGNSAALTAVTPNDTFDTDAFRTIKTIDTSWINGRGIFMGYLNGSTLEDLSTSQTPPFDIVVAGDSVQGMCGANLRGATGTAISTRVGNQDTEATISASRPAYLFIDGEIFKATACSISQDTYSIAQERDSTALVGDLGLTMGVSEAAELTYTISARAQLGTSSSRTIPIPTLTQATHTKIRWVYDYTIPAFLIEKRLDRFSHNCPEIEFTTPFDPNGKDLSIGEVIAFDCDGDDLPYARATISPSEISTETFEVTRKEYLLDESPPKIRYRAIWLANTGSSPTYTVEYPGFNMTIAGLAEFNARRGMANNILAQAFVIDGLEWSIDSGLVADMSEGSASFGLNRFDLIAASATVDASKDTFVSFDCLGGILRFRAETTGAADPTWNKWEVPLAKIVAGASSISSIVDLREFRQIAETGVLAESVVQARNVSLRSDFTTSFPGGNLGTWSEKYGNEDNSG